MPAAYPKLLSRNYITQEGVNTASSGSTIASRIADWDVDSVWQSSGSNDVTVETVQHDLYFDATAISRTIDTIILRNHNLKKWKVQYWNGSTWVDTSAVYTTDNGSVTVATITPVSTNKLRLYMEETQTVDAEKYVGEWYAGEVLFTFPEYFESDYEETTDESVKMSKSWFGNHYRSIFRPTPYRYEKATIKFSIKNLSDSDIVSLRAIKTSTDTFVIYPFPDTDTDKLYQVHWTSPWGQKLTAPLYVTTKSWTVNFTFEEI